MAGLSQIGATTDCFFRDNPINSSNWAGTIAQTSVMVMTAQLLLNVLKSGVANMHQISLLVSCCMLAATV